LSDGPCGRSLRYSIQRLGAAMEDLHIRPLEPADREGWQVLWEQYLVFYAARLPPEVTQATWQRLHGDARFAGWVACQGTAVVGFVHVVFHASTWTRDDVAYLEDLYVASKTRGGGIATALIATAAARARERGAEKLYWLTRFDNERARRLYDRVARLSPFIVYEQSLG
jgi:ribosomal protein S18 acetylase RimI-like enzyme